MTRGDGQEFAHGKHALTARAAEATRSPPAKGRSRRFRRDLRLDIRQRARAAEMGAFRARLLTQGMGFQRVEIRAEGSRAGAASGCCSAISA